MVYPQSIGINDDGSEPNGKAILDVKSLSKGVLLPRLTKVQRDAMEGLDVSQVGMFIFQTDSEPGLYYWNGYIWVGFNEKPYLGTDLASKSINYASGTFEIKVYSNLIWDATESSDWFSLSTTSGSGYLTITVTYDENITGSSRIDDITFSSSGVLDVVVSISQNNQVITDYDGNNYNVVKIGDQYWMKENFKSTHFADGSEIPDGTGIVTTGNLTAQYFFNYGNNPANSETYGRLYTWAAIMKGDASSNSVPSGVQGCCPVGWHVPSNAEWSLLTTYLGGESVAGAKMKESGTTHWNATNNADNGSNFTALPGGFYDGSLNFGGMNENAHFWSCTQSALDKSYLRFLQNDLITAQNWIYSKPTGLSVRCVKN